MGGGTKGEGKNAGEKLKMRRKEVGKMEVRIEK